MGIQKWRDKDKLREIQDYNGGENSGIKCQKWIRFLYFYCTI